MTERLFHAGMGAITGAAWGILNGRAVRQSSGRLPLKTSRRCLRSVLLLGAGTGIALLAGFRLL